MRNNERVVIVTGGSHGIGAGLVAGYRAIGYSVVATSRNIGPSNDENVLAIQGDIRERTTARKVVAGAKERFGRVDTLVNNAGVFLSKPFVEYTQEEFDANFETNVAGVFHMTQVALTEMLSRHSGHIVNIGASFVDDPRSSHPVGLAALTKGGVNALTKELAVEVAKKGVRVNAVAPGIIQTPMQNPAKYEALAKLQPLGRLGQVRDIVDAVLYLESASFVTGQIIRVDGGAAGGLV